MADDFDESQVQWHETPKFDESQIEWAPKGEDQPKTNQGWRGDTAAFLRGVSEQIPGARDIGAYAKSRLGNPLTGESASGDFTKSKRDLERRNAQLAEEHPWSYGAGEVAGGLASVAAPEAAGANLIGRAAKAEQAVARKLAPMLRSSTEANIVAGGLTGMAGGAAQGALHGLGTGTSMDERLSNAAGEAAMGAPLGVAGSALGHVGSRAARKVGEWTGKKAPLPKLPTADEWMNRARAEYAASKAANLRIAPSALVNLRNDMLKELRTKSYNPARRAEHRGIEDALDELNTGRHLTIDDLDQIHRMTTPAARNWNNPEGQTMAAVFRKHMNNFLENISPHQTITTSGSARDAADALLAGRKYWKTGRKVEELGDALKAAEWDASSSGIGANVNNAYRQRIKRILKDADPRIWSPDEIQAMKEFVHGGVTQNVARGLGRFSPVHHNISGVFGPGAAMALSGMNPHVGLGAAATGILAHKAEDYLTEAAKKNLESIVAAGGKKSRVPHLAPEESLAGRRVGVPATTSPVFTPTLESPVFAEDYEEREGRASGGRIGKRDYPAKRLTRVEKAVKRARDAIALETQPLLDQPDHVIANALDIAMKK